MIHQIENSLFHHATVQMIILPIKNEHNVINISRLSLSLISVKKEGGKIQTFNSNGKEDDAA